jgi:hypothetical protein
LCALHKRWTLHTQVAFQYSLLVFRTVEEAGADGAAATTRRVYEVQRRLRVRTEAPGVAKRAEGAFSAARVEPVLCVLAHKVLARAVASGAADARRLLQVRTTAACSPWPQRARPYRYIACSPRVARSCACRCAGFTDFHTGVRPVHTCAQDFLVTALAHWHHHVARLPYGAPPQRGDIDAELAAAPGLAPLTPLVYALLRSVPLATDAAAATDGDAAAYLRLLWGCLPPDQLARAIYPLLLAFDGPDEQPLRQCPLSRAALDGPATAADDIGAAGGRSGILVMDAFHAVLVVQRATAAAAGAPWPPPPDSTLRRTIQELKATRRIVPEVRDPWPRLRRATAHCMTRAPWPPHQVLGPHCNAG